jgi:tRNA A37 threonylcarbamoyladenosine synthetase subunit TsaC/SUA5/YrdC
VNRSGEQAQWRISDIIAAFEKDVDLIIDGGDLPARKPSTILDIRTNPHKLIRRGACEIPASVLSG